MNIKKLKLSAFFAAVLALVALITLTASTYAWFTFRTYTNVTPVSGTVSRGEGDLLIANSPNGIFDTACDLIVRDPDAELLPVTTADLRSFFSVSAQDSLGMATAYAAADDRAQDHTLNGTLYLKAEGGGFDVYLWLPSVDCGGDVQTLAAMRLGLLIETRNGTSVTVMKLDELADTSGAAVRRTIPVPGSVVSGIDEAGTPVYVPDPAVSLSDCAAQGTEDDVQPGRVSVCSMATDEVATVHFWLWLEGCDDNCMNSAQGRDVALQFGFAGVQNGL